MYTSENTHRFPALVLAATFTTAVMIGLSALAQSYAAAAPADARNSSPRRLRRWSRKRRHCGSKWSPRAPSSRIARSQGHAHQASARPGIAARPLCDDASFGPNQYSRWTGPV